MELREMVRHINNNLAFNEDFMKLFESANLSPEEGWIRDIDYSLFDEEFLEENKEYVDLLIPYDPNLGEIDESFVKYNGKWYQPNIDDFYHPSIEFYKIIEECYLTHKITEFAKVEDLGKFGIDGSMADKIGVRRVYMAFGN